MDWSHGPPCGGLRLSLDVGRDGPRTHREVGPTAADPSAALRSKSATDTMTSLPVISRGAALRRGALRRTCSTVLAAELNQIVVAATHFVKWSGTSLKPPGSLQTIGAARWHGRRACVRVRPLARAYATHAEKRFGRIKLIDRQAGVRVTRKGSAYGTGNDRG